MQLQEHSERHCQGLIQSRSLELRLQHSEEKKAEPLGTWRGLSRRPWDCDIARMASSSRCRPTATLWTVWIQPNLAKCHQAAWIGSVCKRNLLWNCHKYIKFSAPCGLASVNLGTMTLTLWNTRIHEMCSIITGQSILEML